MNLQELNALKRLWTSADHEEKREIITDLQRNEKLTAIVKPWIKRFHRFGKSAAMELGFTIALLVWERELRGKTVA